MTVTRVWCWQLRCEAYSVSLSLRPKHGPDLVLFEGLDDIPRDYLFLVVQNRNRKRVRWPHFARIKPRKDKTFCRILVWIIHCSQKSLGRIFGRWNRKIEFVRITSLPQKRNIGQKTDFRKP